MRASCEYRKLADGRFPEFRPHNAGRELGPDIDGDVRAHS